MYKRNTKNVYFLREGNQNDEKEKKWNERFILDKIPPYDAYKDTNYLSLGLIKSKIKYENLLEKQRTKKLKMKSPFYTEHYMINSVKKKNNIQSRTFKESVNDKNKKLIFNIETFQEKGKVYDPKKTYSLTSKHRIYKNKTFSNEKNITYKYINNNYIHKKNPIINDNNSKEMNSLSMEEGELYEEFEIIKALWSKFGVTKKYQENFVNQINNLNRKESLKQFLFLEKKQMQKFKYDLSQLLKKIILRNDEISHLKNLVQVYTNIINDKNFNPDQKDEKLQNLIELKEKKIIEEINDCLLSLRISTINAINQIKNFSFSNSYYFHMNKIDLNKIKSDYCYTEDYILSIRNDLDFVQNSALLNLYDFDFIGGGDPFFLSFTNVPEEGQPMINDNIDKKNDEEKRKKLKLPINEKMLNEVQNCIFFLNQAEILNKDKKNNNNTNKNKVLDYLNNNNYQNIRERDSIDNVNAYGIGCSFKGNIEKNIIKLKMKSGYDKIFSFMGNNNTSSCSDKNKSNKKRNEVTLMTSQQLKERFNEYQLMNDLIYDNKNNREDNNENNKYEEEYKKKDQEMKIQTIKDIEKENKLKNAQKENVNGKEKIEEKEENNYENELKDMENKEKEEEEKRKKIEEEEKIKKEEEEKIKKEEEERKKKEEEDERRKKEEEEQRRLQEMNNIMNKSESIKSQIEEEIKEDEQIKEEEKPKYEINWFTNHLDELTPLYKDYLTTIPNSIKYDFYFPETAKDFIKGIYPKIIIAKENKPNSNNKICGICGTNYYFNNKNEIILKINHISAVETNKEIINKFLDLIEKNLDFKIVEIEFNNNINNKNDLYEIFITKGYKEYSNNLEKITLRKENLNKAINEKEIGPQIKYDSLSILSIVKKFDKNIKISSINYFSDIINEINLALLVSNLKFNDKYKIDILGSSFESSLVKNISKLDSIDFDFIKSKNNECSNIDELTNKEMLPETNNNYAMINNCLNIKINSSMTLDIDNYLYNGIEINKNNIIKENQYMNNIYFIPNLDRNIYIIIYQYNDSFENYLYKNKTNIYNKFISLFNDIIQNFQIEDENEGSDNNKKMLWVPAFSIDTNLFCSNISLNKDIDIKNDENNDMKIKEFNDFLKINYLPDANSDKNIKMNVNIDNDIIIKDKFIFSISHKKFMDYSNIPLISLVNVTRENFIKS